MRLTSAGEIAVRIPMQRLIDGPKGPRVRDLAKKMDFDVEAFMNDPRYNEKGERDHSDLKEASDALIDALKRKSEQPDENGESVEMWRGFVSRWASLVERQVMTGGYRLEEDRDRWRKLAMQLREEMRNELEAVI